MSATNNTYLPPPPYRSMFLDDQGFISQPWAEWLMKGLYQRVGGGTSITHDQLEALVADSTSHLASRPVVPTESALPDTATNSQATIRQLSELSARVEAMAEASSVKRLESMIYDLQAVVASTGTDGSYDPGVVHIAGAAETITSPKTFTKTITSGLGSITTSQPWATATQTWNAGGVTFVGQFFNVTDTASAAASLLADWQVGGVSKVNLSKTGMATLAAKLQLRATDGASGGAAYGVSWFSPAYYTWADYMAPSSGGGAIGPSGGAPASFGGVTSYARRYNVEDTANYGWIWESGANTASATVAGKMALRSDTGDLTIAGNYSEVTANGATWVWGTLSEEITLSTSAFVTLSSANLLPANSYIEGISLYITTTITGAGNYSVGDGSNATRFLPNSAVLTAGSTQIGMSNSLQTAADKVSITCAPKATAGKVRVTTFFRTLSAPTS